MARKGKTGRRAATPDAKTKTKTKTTPASNAGHAERPPADNPIIRVYLKEEARAEKAIGPGPVGVEAWRDMYCRIAESVNAMDLAISAMPQHGCNVPRGAKCLGCGSESDWTPIGEAYDDVVSGIIALAVIAGRIAPALPATGANRTSLVEVAARALEACALDCLGQSPLVGDSIDADAGRALGDRVDAITADLRAALGVPGWRGLLANTPAAEVDPDAKTAAHAAGVALTRDHEAILAVLGKTPTKCKTVIDVAAAGPLRNRETVGRLLRELADAGVVHRPFGSKKGYALTDPGLKRLADIPRAQKPT